MRRDNADPRQQGGGAHGRLTFYALAAGTCLAVALCPTTLAPPLAALRPLGMYGSLHCGVLSGLTLWQTTPDFKRANSRSKYGEPVNLVLSFLGCVIITRMTESNEGPLLLLVQLFLLPMAASMQVSNGDLGGPLGIYLVLHFAMSCSRFTDNFWDMGWQYCTVALVFDGLVLGSAHARAAGSTQMALSLDRSGSMMSEMLTFLADGFCALQDTGSILMVNPGLTGLLDHDHDAVANDWVGLPFQSLQPKEGPKKVGPVSGYVEPGPCRLSLKKKGGEVLDVETLTLRCSLPRHMLANILGQELDASCQEVYLRTIRLRTTQSVAPPTEQKRHGSLSDLGVARALSELGAYRDLQRDKDSGSCVSSMVPNQQPGGHFGSRRSPSAVNGATSPLGWPKARHMTSDVASAVSAAASDNNPTSLSSRRLELMRGQANRGDGTSFFLELEVPGTGEGSTLGRSSVLSGQARARVRMRSKAGNRPDNDNESMLSMSHVSYVDETEVNSEEDEVMETEVLGAEPTPDGNMRVQLEFKSNVLSQQRQELQTVCDELASARRDLQRRGGVQAEQTEILKNFRKIVTRTANEVCEEGSPNVRVSIVEPRDAERESVEQLCRILGLPHKSFADIEAAEADEDGQRCNSKDVLNRPNWSRTQFACKAAAELTEGGAAVSSHSPDVVLRRLDAMGPPARIILLSATMLEVMPADWCDKAFIVLTSTEDDKEYMEWLLPGSLGDRAQERLRGWGVHEALRHPLNLETLRTLARQGLKRQLVDDYLLVQSLGSGGTSEVYDTRRLRDGEVFALKEINVSRLLRRKCGKSDLQMVWKEVEVLRELSWPTVLHLVDAWWGDGAKALYMLLPAFGGGPLTKQVEAAVAQARTISLDRIADWYAQTLHAMTYLHWCGVVHRDIKTENLLLPSTGRTLCVGDLGSAELLPGHGSHPSADSCVAAAPTTPKITPPEVYQKGVHYASSDMWGVAATFYEVVLLKPLLNITLADHNAVFQVQSEAPDFTSKLRQALQGCDQGYTSEGQGTQTHVFCEDFTRELSRMLRQDPLQRPAAATLVNGEHVSALLRSVLRGAMPPAEGDRHFQRFEQIIEESV